MGAFKGIDINDIRQGAASLLAGSATLADVTQRIASVAATTTWVGPDASRFEAEVTEVVLPQLASIMTTLETAAAAMNSDAAQQEFVSRR